MGVVDAVGVVAVAACMYEVVGANVVGLDGALAVDGVVCC